MQDPSNRPVGCHPVSAFRHGTAAMGVGALAVAALLPLGCNGPLGSVPARRSVGAGCNPCRHRHGARVDLAQLRRRGQHHLDR